MDEPAGLFKKRKETKLLMQNIQTRKDWQANWSPTCPNPHASKNEEFENLRQRESEKKKMGIVV